MTDRATLATTVEAYLLESGHDWEPGTRDGEYVVSLPGDKKLKTVASVVVSDTALSVSAFVIRNPDENHVEVYRFLLRRNLRLPGLAYAVDKAGDVYVTGRMPAAGVDADALDQLLGVVLTAADEPFNELLVMGFLQLDAQGVGVAGLARREPAQPRGVPPHPGPPGRPRPRGTARLTRPEPGG